MTWSGSRRWLALVCLAASGCSVMREIPRDRYAEVGERRWARVETGDGRRYDLERVRIGTDSLTGLARRDNESRFEEFDTVRLGLDDVARMSVRGVDWYRTGLLAGVALAAVLAAVITQAGDDEASGGDGPCGPRPCP